MRITVIDIEEVRAILHDWILNVDDCVDPTYFRARPFESKGRLYFFTETTSENSPPNQNELIIHYANDTWNVVSDTLTFRASILSIEDLVIGYLSDFKR